MLNNLKMAPICGLNPPIFHWSKILEHVTDRCFLLPRCFLFHRLLIQLITPKARELSMREKLSHFEAEISRKINASHCKRIGNSRYNDLEYNVKERSYCCASIQISNRWNQVQLMKTLSKRTVIKDRRWMYNKVKILRAEIKGTDSKKVNKWSAHDPKHAKLVVVV